jgi:hypothetical protein
MSTENITCWLPPWGEWNVSNDDITYWLNHWESESVYLLATTLERVDSVH